MAGTDRPLFPPPPKTPPPHHRQPPAHKWLIGLAFAAIAGLTAWAVWIVISIASPLYQIGEAFDWKLPEMRTSFRQPGDPIPRTATTSLKPSLEKVYPDVSPEYLDAMNDALDYQAEIHPSKAKLYRQLIDAYPDAHKEDAARWAVDTIEVKWRENALYWARFLKTATGASHQEIYRQLTAEDDLAFTKEEAEWALAQLEADATDD